MPARRRLSRNPQPGANQQGDADSRPEPDHVDSQQSGEEGPREGTHRRPNEPLPRRLPRAAQVGLHNDQRGGSRPGGVRLVRQGQELVAEDGQGGGHSALDRVVHLGPFQDCEGPKRTPGNEHGRSPLPRRGLTGSPHEMTSSSAFASFKSAVSNPSVNQP
jgi:hypothetical protein